MRQNFPLSWMGTPRWKCHIVNSRIWFPKAVGHERNRFSSSSHTDCCGCHCYPKCPEFLFAQNAWSLSKDIMRYKLIFYVHCWLFLFKHTLIMSLFRYFVDCFPSLMIDFELLQPPITTSYPSHPSQEDRRIVPSELDFRWNSKAMIKKCWIFLIGFKKCVFLSFFYHC